MKSFRKGGIHPPEYKISKTEAIQDMPLPESVVLPLGQHIGAPATPCVQKGDHVLVGQVIGTANGFVSSYIHSSVSGTVTAVDNQPDVRGIRCPSVTIKVEGDQWLETIDRSDALVKDCSLSREAILKKITEAGIVGLGGATFPAHVKLTIPQGKHADVLIINGVECEPFLTADHRLMLEKSEEILIGIDLLCKVLDVDHAFIGIEGNKPDAIERLNELSLSYPNIHVVPLRIRYPQGSEKQLIEAISGREVPSGKLPLDVGVVVQNVGTAFAVYEAVQKNKPLFERIVTVTGRSLAHPANLRVRLGASMSSLIDYCGGLPEDVGKVICGGPMMGRAIANIDAPVTKGTSGIVMIREKGAVRKQPQNCIKCAKCVSVCCMGLEPYLISKLARLERFDELEALHVTDCLECGSCSYTCPANLPLLDYIRVGKAEVLRRIRMNKTQQNK